MRLTSSTEEEKALKMSLLKDHVKDGTKGTFKSIGGMASASGETIKKVSGGAVEKAELLKDKTKSKMLGAKDESSSAGPSQQEIIDENEESSASSASKTPKLSLVKHVWEFVRFALIGLLVYLIGYLRWTFLLVLIPVGLFLIASVQKERKKAKAALFRDIHCVGEQRALRARLKELPSWFNFPDVERVEWINTMVQTLWPHVAVYTDHMLRTTVEPVARQELEKYKLGGFKFQQIEFGQVPPRLSGVKVYRTSVPDEIVFDVDFEYYGDADIGISLMKISASVSDVQVEGKLRIIFKPLIGDVPIVGGIQAFFLKMPSLNFDLGGAASILDFPGLNSMLKDAIEDQIALNLILPNKIAVILTDKVSAEELRMPRPVGALVLNAVEGKNLNDSDSKFTKIDPYIIFTQGLRTKKTKTSKGKNPSWEEQFEFAIEVPESEDINVTVMDKDKMTDDDFLGRCIVHVAPVFKQTQIDTFFTLDGVDTGQIRLKLNWLTTSKSASDYQSTQGRRHSRAVLSIYLDSCSVRPTCSGANPPQISVRLSCHTEERKTKTITNWDPVFQEGFNLMLRKVEGETMKITIFDEKEEETLVEYFFQIGDLKDEPDLYRALQEYPLPRDLGCVRLAARLRFLLPPKGGGGPAKVGGVVGGVLGGVGDGLGAVAGQSAKMAGDAAKSLGSAGKTVGTATTSAVKSFGSAAAGGTKSLLGAPSSVVKRVSPRFSRRLRSSEASGGQSSAPVDGALLETNLDELDDADYSEGGDYGGSSVLTTPKGRLPSSFVSDMGGSSPNVGVAATSATSASSVSASAADGEDKVRRRLSDNLKFGSGRK